MYLSFHNSDLCHWQYIRCRFFWRPAVLYDVKTSNKFRMFIFLWVENFVCVYFDSQKSRKIKMPRKFQHVLYLQCTSFIYHTHRKLSEFRFQQSRTETGCIFLIVSNHGNMEIGHNYLIYSAILHRCESSIHFFRICSLSFFFLDCQTCGANTQFC